MSLSVSCALLLVYFVVSSITVKGTFLKEILRNPQEPVDHLGSCAEAFKSSYGLESTSSRTFSNEEDPLDSAFNSDDMMETKRGKKESKVWDYWSKWSACSVSCGVGKMTRWRHCLSQSCEPGEKEAQIKTCSMNPCA
ncbi:unnamed protein product [Callosobruchus maculatus]|uniref:ADAMTS cysteine-rich domain-containing protein n=1 Tax=Callosobruchus maculatus TaxID=64391 RepID=A0A653CZ87_CALMS|nr:unnamed protein product [Callosobruchus maculatus]